MDQLKIYMLNIDVVISKSLPSEETQQQSESILNYYI